MRTHSAHAGWTRPSAWTLVLVGFIAGALAVPLFHQALVALLYAADVIPRPPFRMDPTEPWGVPQIVSSSFWGGVWGIILLLVFARAGRLRGTGFWLGALLFGAIFPTLVAWTVVAPLKGQEVSVTPSRAAIGLAVNGAWGLGTAVISTLLLRLRGPRRP